MKKFLVALGFVLFAGPAPAYFIWGIGEMSCNELVTAKIEFDHANEKAIAEGRRPSSTTPGINGPILHN